MKSIDHIELGRRLAIEQSVERSGAIRAVNAVFDESGHYIVYATMLGVKVVDFRTGQCVRILARQEAGVRFLRIGLYQGKPRSRLAAVTIVRARSWAALRDCLRRRGGSCRQPRLSARRRWRQPTIPR